MGLRLTEVVDAVAVARFGKAANNEADGECTKA